MNNLPNPIEPTSSTNKTSAPPSTTGKSIRKPKTKKQTAIQLLRRAQGASLPELEKRLSWQPHSVRGFLSATARKLDGFELVSQKTATGQRRYRLVAKEQAAG